METGRQEATQNVPEQKDDNLSSEEELVGAAIDQGQETARSDAVESEKTVDLSKTMQSERELHEQAQDEIAGFVVIDDEPAVGEMKITFTDDVRRDRTEVYTIPVDAPEPELILADYGQVKISRPDEEGIDVFEEFGDEGYSDYDKWAVGGQVAPIYSYRNLGPSEADAMFANSYLNAIESGIVSYAGGVSLNYSPAKRLSIQSGLNYFRLGMSVQDTYIASADEKFFGTDFPAVELAMSNSSGDIQLGEQKSNTILSNFRANQDAASILPETYVSGTAPDPAIKQGDLQQNFEYIEIPVILRYKVVDRRAGVNLLGGLSTNFLVGSNVYFQENGNREQIGTTENLKPVNYSSVLGLGFQYSINPNLHFNMEPTFRYYLNSINSGSGPGSHPYSIGFFTGISYSF